MSCSTTDVTAHLPLVGAPVGQPPRLSDGLALYGTERALVEQLPGHKVWLTDSRAAASTGAGSAALSEAMVRFAARYEQARTVEDLLARRSRLLFLDAAQAERIAPNVARLLMQETGVDPQLPAFEALARRFASAATQGL